MSIADELQKLDALRASGALTEAEYHRAKQRVLEGTTTAPPPPFPRAREAIREAIPPSAIPIDSAPRPPERNPLKRFMRSTEDKVFGGVCGGLAKQIPAIPTWVFRVGFCFAFFAYGTGLLIYILLWIFVPSDDSMAGEGQNV